MRIADKHIIITGASSGIGLEMLKLLMQYPNVRIIAVARNIDNIPCKGNVVIPFSADVSTQQGVDTLFDFAHRTFGQTDIFIANAGFAYLETLSKPDWQHIQNIFNLNVCSPIYSLQKFASESRDKKTFVCTISGAGLVPLPAYSLYCSTKAALKQFINTYNYEKSDNLLLTSVFPVATRTDFFDKAAKQTNAPLPWPRQEADTVAKKIINANEKERKEVYPSLIFRLLYPIGRAFPILLHLYSLSEKKKVKSLLN